MATPLPGDTGAAVTHYIVAIPCDRETGQVPYQALVSALSWYATRLAPSAAASAPGNDSNEDENEDEDFSCCGGTDWQAVGHDGSEQSLAELQAAVRDAAAHQRAAAAELPCRLVVAYLDCAPTGEAEFAFLRRLPLTGRSVVVHVFGRCSLAGLPHVALHHSEGQLPARQVWASARRPPPASLRPALAAAQFLEFCRTDYRLAVSEDFQLLLAKAAPPGCCPLDADLAPWQVLDYLESTQPRLAALAGWLDGSASDELLAAAMAARDSALRLARGEEPAFTDEHRLAAAAVAQAALARLLEPAPLVSVPLAGACAGRFAGALLAAGLDPAAFGHSARPELERAMVRRGARFVASLVPGGTDARCWRLECRRLDEADDCRAAAAGFARLAGRRAARPNDVGGGAATWAAGVTLTSEEMARLRRRLWLPTDFGEAAAADAAEEAAAESDGVAGEEEATAAAAADAAAAEEKLDSKSGAAHEE